MKKLVMTLSVLSMWPASAAWAQLLPPNGAGVAMAQWHTIVRNVDATKKFWTLLGGTPLRVDGTEVMKFHGVLVFMQPGSPAGDRGNTGCVLDHPGFTMAHGVEFLAKLKEQGIPVDPIEGRGPESGYIATPDGMRIEMQGKVEDVAKRTLLGFPSADLELPIATDHLHFFLPQSADVEAQAWWGKLFGAVPLRENNRGNTLAGDVAGIRIRLALARGGALLKPTKGQSLDYIGFEVKDLDAFVKKLEASGIKLDQPVSKSRHKGFASAAFTDPWGTSIELTEGLNRF